MAILSTRSRRRTASLVAAAGLVLTNLVLPAAASNTDPSDLVEGCAGAPSASSKFSDYGSLSGRERDVVDCLSSGYKGDRSDTDFVLQGSGGQVSFDTTISRAQFAAILNRVADYLGVAPRTGDPNNPTFADVAPGTFFFGEIEELFARGLTNGAGSDTQDVDNDGNRSELIYNPGGQVSYAQIIAFVERLLTDGAGYTLPVGQSHNEENLDCGFFNTEKDALDNAGFLRTFNTPRDCRLDSPRGLVFDLISVALDHAVETGKADNPFATASGSVSLTADKTSVSSLEQINLTITVLDGNDQPVRNAKVEVFAVSSSDAFDNTGNPKDPGTISVANGNKYGTGASSAVLDNSDPQTNGQGQITTTVETKGSTAGTFDVYAFTGKVGDTWKDVKNLDGQASTKVTVNFTAVPAGILSTSSANGFPIKYGEDVNTVLLTVVDADGKAIKQKDQPVVVELFRRNNGGAETFFTRAQLLTDKDGVATWVAPSAPDPSAGGGDQTADRFNATFDTNANGLADDSVQNAEDLVVQWRDASRGTPANATITLPNENSAKGDLMGALRGDGVTQTIQVTVTNVYGQPATGAHVQLSRGTPVNQQVTDGGVTIFTVSAPNLAASHTFTALVDREGTGTAFTPADVHAISVTNDEDVTIEWVNDGPSLTTQYNNLSVAGRNVGSPNSIFLYSTTTRIRAFYGIESPQTTDNDRYVYGTSLTACTDGTPEIGRGAFEAALDADVEGNDLIDVTYQPFGGSSCWVLQVVGSGGGPVVP